HVCPEPQVTTMDNKQAMQEALEAAVRKMNNGNGSANASVPADPISAAISILPKLIGKGDDTEELLEAIGELNRQTMDGMQEQVRILRKQVHRIGQMQEQMMRELRQLAEQQHAASSTLLLLAEHMERLQIVDEAADVSPPPPRKSSGKKSRPRPSE